MDRLSPHDGAVPETRYADVVVLLCRAPRGNLHAGLLYWSRGKYHVLHLGWEDILSNTWSWKGVRTSPIAEPELLFAAARLCRKIWQRYVEDRRFPYGLHFVGTTFDDEGRLVLGPQSRGLSCATLLLAVLESVGIVLIDAENWPVRRDDDQSYLALVREFASDSHLAVLQREVEEGVRRVRPEEATAACLLPPPSTFPTIRPLADQVVGRLPP